MELPSRQIACQSDLDKFGASATCEKFWNFIEALNQSVKGSTLRAELHLSPALGQLLTMLNTFRQWVDEMPKEVHQGRFGNPSFRIWYDRVVEESTVMLERFIPKDWMPEISTYLFQSFGDRQRIDYGTGHEAHFIAFLYCLCHERIAVLHKDEYLAIVNEVFYKGYIGLMRKLQSTFWLEPAGSHGVWGLDDYHFLPFYFGAAQLSTHPILRPKSIHSREILEDFSPDYMYLDCVLAVNRIKTTASLRWHSPLLDDISSVKTWTKVNEGLGKMYRKEVLGKLPIMQHFRFGQLLPFESGHKGIGNDVSHDHTGRGDCCGNPIPSAFPQAQGRLRDLPTIPFD